MTTEYIYIYIHILIEYRKRLRRHTAAPFLRGQAPADANWVRNPSTKEPKQCQMGSAITSGKGDEMNRHLVENKCWLKQNGYKFDAHAVFDIKKVLDSPTKAAVATNEIWNVALTSLLLDRKEHHQVCK